jgi:hypothetical protein
MCSLLSYCQCLKLKKMKAEKYILNFLVPVFILYGNKQENAWMSYSYLPGRLVHKLFNDMTK